MKKFTVSIILLLLFSLGYSQTTETNQDSIPNTDNSSAKKNNNPFVLKPTIGLGIGSLKYYGDISSFHRGNPLIGNFSYDFNVENDLTKFLKIRIYMLWGHLSMNEHSTTRNFNFRTRLTAGGLSFNYNFNNFLKPDRTISPFVSVGIESIEFDSKADMYDKYGNKYNYWSDGTIRNIPQDSPDASKAIIIERDYTYETDLRALNADGKGKYVESSFALPVGVGARMHLSPYLQFVVSTTLHLGFSDIIDNVARSSDIARLDGVPPTKGTDKFLYTAVSLHYSFQNKQTEKKVTPTLPMSDYLAGDNSDQDHDGINDFIDKCPNTPAGVSVDANGCPVDADHDGVPDFRDLDPQTKANVPVLPNGKEYTDTLIHLDYLAYTDSTGFWGADTVNQTFSVGGGKKRKEKTYMVQVGSFKTGITTNLVNKFLSLPDVKVHDFGDTLTVFTVGNYNNLPDAIKRKINLTEQGYDQAEVVTKDKKGNIVSVGDKANNMAVNNQPNNTKETNNNNPENTTPNTTENNNLVYRIQIGAFTNKVPKSKFADVPDLEIIKMDDGLYHYHSGSFNNHDDAERALQNIINKGYKDAFVVTYKSGKRVKEGGTSNVANTNTNINKQFVSFTVQLGVFRFKVPNEVFAHYLQMGNVSAHVEGDLTRYTTGKFNTYNEAEDYKNKLAKEGFPAAFVISFYKNKLIPLDQARKATEGQ